MSRIDVLPLAAARAYERLVAFLREIEGLEVHTTVRSATLTWVPTGVQASLLLEVAAKS